VVIVLSGILPERAEGIDCVDFVTTVDQSDIRGLVTDMRYDPTGASSLYKLASATSMRPAFRVRRGFPRTVLTNATDPYGSLL
jgi:hypothetical protein